MISHVFMLSLIFAILLLHVLIYFLFCFCFYWYYIWSPLSFICDVSSFLFVCLFVCVVLYDMTPPYSYMYYIYINANCVGNIYNSTTLLVWVTKIK